MSRPMFTRLAAGAASTLALLLTALIPTSAQAQTETYQQTRTSSFTYRADGLLQTETIEPDKPQLCVLSTHAYDDYGNKKGVSTENCNGATGLSRFDKRQSQSERDAYTASTPAGNIAAPRGSLVTASKVALGPNLTDPNSQAESRQQDPRFSVTTTLTGPNGLTTTWQLDEFGRKVLEQRADGTRTAVMYCLLSNRTILGVDLDRSSNSDACPTPASGEAPDLAIRFEHSEPRDANNQKIGAFSRIYYDRAGRKLRSATEAFDGAEQPGGINRLIVQDTDYSAFGAPLVVTQPYFLDSGASTATGAANSYGLTLTDYDVLGRAVASYSSDPATANAAGQAGQTGGSQAAVTFGNRGSRQATVSQISYSGLTTTTTDDKGRTRTEERNPDGKVVRVTDSMSAQLVHQHDAFGNLIKTKDPLGNTVSISYDERGRKVAMSDPDAGVTVYCYDALGQLKAQQTSAMRGSHSVPTCPNVAGEGTTAPSVANWTTMAYDRLGRLVSRMEPEYGTTWSYDNYADGSACAKGLGKLCETRTTHGVTRKVAYDGNGRPLSTRTDYGGTAGGGSALSATSSVSYDSVGRVAVQTYPSGLAVRMQYTARGYLEALKLESAVTVNPLPAVAGNRPGASTALGAGSLLWQAKAINAWGKAELQSYGNGIDNRAVFDAQTGRLQQLTAGKGSATDVVNQRLTWDSRTGQLWSRVDALGDGGSPGTSIEVLDTHEYDPLGRLTKYTVSGGSASSPSTRAVELQYNALGMLLYKSDVGVYTYPTQGVVNGRPHAVQSIAGALYANYGYDLNGSVTSATGGKYRSVSYTSFNLPDGGSGIAGPGGSPRYTWQYDESHARIAETRTNAQGTRTTWFLHPDNQGGLGFEREVAANGAQSNRHYLSAGGAVIGVIVTSGALVAPGSPIVAVKLEYWHKDHLGSTVATSDHLGNVTQRMAYDPFGKRRYTNGTYDASGNLLIDWTTDTNGGNDRGFTGHEHLDDVGLIHMNGRVFDPVIARFMQADPFIQDPTNLQNYDRFTYCYNNPTTCTDPSGNLSIFGHKILPGLFNNKNLRIGLALAAAWFLGPSGYAWGEFGVLGASVTSPIMQAAIAGFVSGTILSGTVKGGLQGAFSAALFAGVGDFLTGTGIFEGAGAIGETSLTGVALHGVAGCVSSVASGAKCGPGFLSAAFSQAALPYKQQFGDALGNRFVGGVVSSMAIGGTASVLGGGKFSNGAKTAAFGYLFNHWAHEAGRLLAGYGVEAHQLLQDYEKDNGYVVESKCATPTNCVDGRFDIADRNTKEVWEIKRNSFYGLAMGELALDAYTAPETGLRRGGDLAGLKVGNTLSLWKGDIEYQYTNYGDGSIGYSRFDRTPQQPIRIYVPRLGPVPGSSRGRDDQFGY